MESSVMFDIQKGFVNLKHGKVSYSIYGKREEGKKLVVCIHGIGSYSYCWKFLAQSLSKDNTVLVFDLYGKGFSDSPNKKHSADLFTEQLFELVSHPDIKFPKFNLIGHSMGGAISVHFASKYPDMVASLVLLSPAGAHFKMPPGSFMLKLPGLGASIFKGVQDENKVIAQDFFDVEKSKEVIEWITECRKHVNMDTFCKSFVNSFKNFPLTGLSKIIMEVGKHERPSLLLWGDADESVSFKECFPFYESAFKTHARVFHNTKHAFFLERADEVNSEIIKFINGEFPEKKESQTL